MTNIDNTEKNLAKATDLLADLDREEKSGFNLGDRKESNEESDMGGALGQKKNSKDTDDNNPDAYDDDFEDDIEEDLPEEQPHDILADADGAAASGGNMGVTVSQSLGVDPSVDSLALEDYDHVEPVERLV